MQVTIKKNDLAIISLILRIAIGSLFLGAAMIKLKGGISGNIDYYLSIFKDSDFPIIIVKFHASVIMFLEFVIGIWLIIGFKLKYAWIASAFTLISLAFGMIFVYKFETVSDNYIYVVISILGYLLSSYDQYCLGKNLAK